MKIRGCCYSPKSFKKKRKIPAEGSRSEQLVSAEREGKSESNSKLRSGGMQAWGNVLRKVLFEK